MPYAKKTYRKKRPYNSRKRRRPNTNSRAIMNPIRSLGSASKYFFKRSLYTETITSSGQLKAGTSWNLTQVPSYTDFTGLFDQYRINMVTVQFIYRATNTSMIESINSTHIGLPILHWVIDLDDATPPASIAELENYGKKRHYIYDTGKRAKTIKVRPRCLNNINGSGASAANTLGNRKAWIDCGDNDVPLYGLKYIIDVPQSSTTYNVSFDVITTYYMQFRQSR